MAVDPVCNMTVEEDEAVGTSVYNGTKYYFCSEICRERFESDPESYLYTDE